MYRAIIKLKDKKIKTDLKGFSSLSTTCEVNNKSTLNTSENICIGMIQSISMKEYPPDTFDEFSFTVYIELNFNKRNADLDQSNNSIILSKQIVMSRNAREIIKCYNNCNKCSCRC